MDGMKKQMVMMVPQMVIMGWINFFFQGFVLSTFPPVLSSYSSPVPYSQESSLPFVLHAALDLYVVRLPFPLTMGFKSMMQRGIETQDMDVTWVSSLSWYFLNLFGLNGLFRLLLGSDNGAFLTFIRDLFPCVRRPESAKPHGLLCPTFLSETTWRTNSDVLYRCWFVVIAADSSQSMTSGGPMAAMVGGAGGGAPAPGAPVDYAKLFAAEKDNLQFAEGQYKWVGQDVERRVLERWGKIPPSSSSS